MDLIEKCHFCSKYFSTENIVKISQNSLKRKFNACKTCKESLKELGLLKNVYKKGNEKNLLGRGIV